MEAQLTDKQAVFVAEYVTCWNATEAARRAGYSEKTARQIGAQNLSKLNIRQAIKAHLEAHAMSAAEATYRLSEMARGTMADFVDPLTDTINLAKAERAGKLGLIKSFSRTDTEHGGSTRIELYDAQAALVQIIKQHQLAAGEPTSRVDVNVRNLPALPADTLDAIFTE